MIEYDIFIAAPRQAVWEFLTRHDHIQQWWGKGVNLHVQENDETPQPWIDHNGIQHTTRGSVTAIEANTRLQLNWTDDGWPHASFSFTETARARMSVPPPGG